MANKVLWLAVPLSFALLSSGCAKKSDNSSPPTVVTNVSGAPSAEATTPVPAATTEAPYPDDYAAAVLKAWGDHDNTRLALLTSDPGQFTGISGNPNQHWTRIECQGAMGSTYCAYYNDNGDAISVKTGNEATSEKKYHAASLGSWSAMSYPGSAKDYVDKFLHAWIDGNVKREQLLGTPSVVSHFNGLSKPDYSYTLATEGAAGHTYVHITHSGGFDQTVGVVNELVAGHKSHAIDGCMSGC